MRPACNGNVERCRTNSSPQLNRPNQFELVFSFQSMRRVSAARDRQHLVVGPWNHHGAADGGHAYETGQPINPLGDLSLPPQGFFEAREVVRCVMKPVTIEELEKAMATAFYKHMVSRV